MNRRRWTRKELAYLRRTAGRIPDAEIARALCRSFKSVTNQKFLRGLCLRKGSPEYRANLSRRNKGRRFNPAGEFKKGNVPWITGTRGIRQSPATEFKKGSLHGAAARKLKGYGAVTIRTHRKLRTRWIKLSGRGWIPFARHLYERREGPIPEGYFVVHRDGDSLNDELDNLMLMSRKYLTTWLKRIRPKMEARRKAKNVKAQRHRWDAYYARKLFDAVRPAEAAG